MDEIQKVDPRARRRARLLVLFGTLAGLVVIWLVEYFGPALEDWLTREPEHTPSRVRLAFTALALTVGLPTLALASHFWRLGQRIIRTEQFPTPGTLTMRETRMLREALTRRRGLLLQLVAVFLVAVAGGFAIVLWQLVALLDSSAP